MPSAKCPICGLNVELPDDVLPGEIIEHECGVVLEVVKDRNDGVVLKPLEGISEDWGE
ncbi:MAG: sulfonate ABC transporter [Thermoprotei archaeon]|nr:MAG: sulfonate ABC transporter [Thermoprotei archaeon]